MVVAGVKKRGHERARLPRGKPGIMVNNDSRPKTGSTPTIATTTTTTTTYKLSLCKIIRKPNYTHL
jgi:hypothetical protein